MCRVQSSGLGSVKAAVLPETGATLAFSVPVINGDNICNPKGPSTQ